MKSHIEQAGLWLKPNTASQLKPDMPQADISTQDKGVFLLLHILNEILWNIEIWKQFKVRNHWSYF